ncbi:COX assembly mitochondrial protein homolog [Malaya genurostris]|uniref:COX assembly mitochondrial protein homolog n=1 Tax=Malaya genurostris TaxID=325434 RepID=UPI0026F3D725|nr:COX assembly mitochondrial protein homolog [Malaya genurostris]
MAQSYGGSEYNINTTGLSQLNPHGLGDPNDRSLRKVEVEVLIPKIMRERSKVEKCIEEVSKFEACCKDSGILMTVKCQKQNEALKACSLKWYNDEQFKSECKEIYLKERSEYRRTGIPKKYRNLEQANQ